MPEFGGEGLEQVINDLSQQSERHATNAQIVLTEIERRRREAREQGRNFLAPTGPQLLDRLQSANSPFFDSVAWTEATPTPGTIDLTVGIFNPDPTPASSLFVHVFIGPANLAADVGQALALVDPRFPRLTEPEFFGLTVNPSTAASLDFSIAVPANIEPSIYLGNSFLFAAQVFGSAELLERVLFGFKVT